MTSDRKFSKKKDETKTIQIQAQDPQGGPVTFSLVSNPPDGVSITPDGVLQWSSTTSNTVGIYIAEECGKQDQASFTLYVEDGSSSGGSSSGSSTGMIIGIVAGVVVVVAMGVSVAGVLLYKRALTKVTPRNQQRSVNVCCTSFVNYCIGRILTIIFDFSNNCTYVN